jgi:hypothetical protein
LAGRHGAVGDGPVRCTQGGPPDSGSMEDKDLLGLVLAGIVLLMFFTGIILIA